MTIRAWLRNPWQTAAVAALALAGVFSPYALAGAAVLFAVLEIVAGVRKAEGPRWWPSLWPRGAAPITILYDGQCVLCSRSKANYRHARNPGTRGGGGPDGGRLSSWCAGT